MKNKAVIISVFLFFPGIAPAQSVQQAHTEVSLISRDKAVAAGERFWAGIRMRMDPGWHVYWHNPGDSGLPPKFNWHLPPGWRAGPMQWPAPQRIDLPPLTVYGYAGEVLFLTEIQTSSHTPAAPVEIGADVRWLACQVDCIPGKAVLKQAVDLSSQGRVPDLSFAQVFADAFARLPQDQSPWEAKAYLTASQWRLHWLGPPAPEKVEFFPDRGDLMAHSSAQQYHPAPDGFALEIEKSNLLREAPRDITGVLKTGRQSFLVRAPVLPWAGNGELSLAIACVFAFLGGLILNTMPCVLPVLSLKAASLAAHHYGRRKSIEHGLAFALGVLVSFWALAIVLLLIKGAGAKIGWGFQFQSPFFTAAMAVVFIVLAFNLFGFFEIGAGLGRLGVVAHLAKGLTASFLNGLLATVVATPCTAPFMGPAIAYALAHSALAALAVFSCLAAGMALPMMIISAFPSLLRFLPKPGPWMNTLKRIMGVFMLLSALWLGWVLALQLNFLPNATRAAQNSPWQAYSPELIEQLKREGKDYFLDFTAAWCLTCQVNDRMVLNNPEVMEKFREKNIILVKADWTQYDPRITRALAQYGRNSIPLYVFYSSTKGREQILSEVITVHELLQVLGRQQR